MSDFTALSETGCAGGTLPSRSSNPTSPDTKPLYLCIHCSWIGEDVVKKTETDDDDEGTVYTHVMTLCPKCGWVCYSEDDSRRNECYLKLAQKIKRLDRINSSSRPRALPLTTQKVVGRPNKPSHDSRGETK